LTGASDGRPQPVERVNECLMDLPIAAGSHRLTMRYCPRGLWTGGWLALVGIAVLGWRRRGFRTP